MKEKSVYLKCTNCLNATAEYKVELKLAVGCNLVFRTLHQHRVNVKPREVNNGDIWEEQPTLPRS